MQKYAAEPDNLDAKYNPKDESDIITIDDLSTAAARGDLNLVETSENRNQRKR